MLSDEVQGELQLKVLQERIPENEKTPKKQASNKEIPGFTFFYGASYDWWTTYLNIYVEK